jgi:hypothetical protein
MERRSLCAVLFLLTFYDTVCSTQLEAVREQDDEDVLISLFVIRTTTSRYIKVTFTESKHFSGTTS